MAKPTADAVTLLWLAPECKQVNSSRHNARILQFSHIGRNLVYFPFLKLYELIRSAISAQSYYFILISRSPKLAQLKPSVKINTTDGNTMQK